jgi:hypothetical protein
VKPWGWAILQQASVELLFPPLKECSKTRLLNLPHAIFIRGKKKPALIFASRNLHMLHLLQHDSCYIENFSALY